MRAVDQVCAAAGRSLVAAGIEDEATRRRVAALGVPLGQGFPWPARRLSDDSRVPPQ